MIAEEYEFTDFITSSNVAFDLSNGLIESNAYSFSAPKININSRIIAVGTPEEPENIMVFFNPRIVSYGLEYKYCKEECRDGLMVSIKRPDEIRLRYQDLRGDTNTTVFFGITSRLIQHEIDYLDGIDVKTLANRYHLEKAKKERKLNNER